MTDAHARIRARILSTSLPDDVHVVELEGREAISELFSFTLTLRVPAAKAVDPDQVIGSRATIAFDETVGDKHRPLRQIHGVIHRCEDLLRIGDARAYRVQVVPRLWLSTLVETLDIFQEQSAPDIVQDKLAKLHLTTDDDRELRLQSEYPKREFTVQYKETDLAFISRLTEHLGISVVFEQGDEVEKVVLVDHAAGFPALPEPIPYAPGHNQSGVFDLVTDSQIVPSNFYVRDYNYRNPGVDLMAEDGFEGFGGGVVEYGGHFKDPDEGKWLAGVRRQEKECRRRIYRGQGADPRLSAGHRVTITGHPYGDIELLPFVVEHHLTQADFMQKEGEATPTYRCRIEAIDAGLTYRPERLTPKPRVTGMVTGIVDGTGSDDYADIDDDGRYRVRFMFDTSGAGEGKASRPVRMMQPHAGGGFGMHFPLRRGTEVLITFIDGDPDRPIICGTVPNPQTPSPVAAGNNRRNVIRTGGNNEINIDDTAGSERIKLTTPNQNTVFQLGAPNGPETGIFARSDGAFTRLVSSHSTSVSQLDIGASLVSSKTSLARFEMAGRLSPLQALVQAADVAQELREIMEGWSPLGWEQQVADKEALISEPLPPNASSAERRHRQYDEELLAVLKRRNSIAFAISDGLSYGGRALPLVSKTAAAVGLLNATKTATAILEAGVEARRLANTLDPNAIGALPSFSGKPAFKSAYLQNLKGGVAKAVGSLAGVASTRSSTVSEVHSGGEVLCHAPHVTLMATDDGPQSMLVASKGEARIAAPQTLVTSTDSARLFAPSLHLGAVKGDGKRATLWLKSDDLAVTEAPTVVLEARKPHQLASGASLSDAERKGSRLSLTSDTTGSNIPSIGRAELECSNWRVTVFPGGVLLGRKTELGTSDVVGAAEIALYPKWGGLMAPTTRVVGREGCLVRGDRNWISLGKYKSNVPTSEAPAHETEGSSGPSDTLQASPTDGVVVYSKANIDLFAKSGSFTANGARVELG